MLTDPFTDRALVFATEGDLTPEGRTAEFVQGTSLPGVPLTDEVVSLRSVSMAVAAMAIAGRAAQG